jgi:tetratricopeptide (TPR) repeat protein
MPMYQVVKTPGGGAWVRKTDAVEVGASAVAGTAVSGALAAAGFVARQMSYRKNDRAWAAVMKAQEAGDWPLELELAKEFARHYPQEQGGWASLFNASFYLQEQLPFAERLEVAKMLDEHLEAHGERGKGAVIRAIGYFFREDMPNLLREANFLVGLEGEDRWRGHYYRASAMMWLGDLDQALADANAALAIRPDDESYARRAEVFWARGDLARAAADYTASLRLDSAQPNRLEMRASVYEEQGDVASAEADRRAVSELQARKQLRKQLLAQAIMQAVVANNARVESQSDYQAVLVTGRPVNHILHLLLTLFTIGLWVFVWLILVLTGGVKRQLIFVDESGYTRIQDT